MRLQHLKFVSIIERRLLPDNMLQEYACGITAVLPSIVPVMLNTLEGGEVDIDVNDDHSHSETLKATFYTEKQMPKMDVAFILGFTDGSSFLVGTREDSVRHNQSDAMPSIGNQCRVKHSIEYHNSICRIPISVNTFIPEAIGGDPQNTQWWREITEDEVDTIIENLS